MSIASPNRISRRAVLRGIGAALTLPLLNSASAQGGTPELWFWQDAYPESLADVSAIEARIDQAVSYGYTGVAFWGSAFSFMGSSVYPANNVPYVQQLVSYAQAKGMKTMATVAPYGYSDDVLINNPNWAEGEHVTGSQFVVNTPGTALVPVNSFGGLVNPGFESGQTGWFDFNDPNMGIDTTVAHTGTASGYIANATGNSRFTQTLNLVPWRQYHGRIWVKTLNFQGLAQILVLDPSSGVFCFNTQIGQQSTQDWTEIEFTFNSRGFSQPLFYFGVWGGCSGSIWFDDVLIEETSLVYVLRRSGTPLRVYNPANPGQTYSEGVDFNPIADPNLTSGALYSFNGFYHAPATVTLPSTTSLRPGQTVAMDYYAVQLVSAVGDVGMCLTESGAQNWLQHNVQSVVGNMPGGVNYLLSYDEMRHMNSCASCKAKNMTAGQLLAWHFGNTVSLVGSYAPSASLYVWNDMFDPYHNAVDNYYFVEGDIAGSWAGIPAGVTILNWNLGNLRNSLSWFAGLNSQQPVPHRQIIAGYYDSGDGAAAATQELQQAAGIPGVAGLMYTTWQPDYSQLQAFAQAAKSNWPSYLASVNPLVDVTSRTQVNSSALTLNRGTGRYSGTITVKNTGDTTITGPLYVYFTLPAGVTLPGLPTSGGLPYVEISVPGGLAPGAVSASASLSFVDPGNARISYTTTRSALGF